MQELHSFERSVIFERRAMRPTSRAYFRHSLLLFVTLITVTIAGTLYPFGKVPILPDADPQNLSELIELLASLPGRYIALITSVLALLASDGETLFYSLSFSISLLLILIVHELGHYIACRIYGVDATLPFFIPTPPMIGPAGTFGAFIKIMSPMPSRKAVFDIGVAGPIAGFIALIPVAILGVVMGDTSAGGHGGLVFANPLLLYIIASVFGTDLHLGFGNPFYFASWVGLLVTALNLIPSGQLDGGHTMYAVFGERVHYWIGRLAFAVMAILSVVGFFYFNSPSGFLIAILLGIMMRVGHPRPWDTGPLDSKRKLIAFVTLIIFALSFVPFPIKIV
ncbi:site-2 protease family protein [Leptolyngbya sp. 7M]|uniref:site-2 protease family protein n=1 Tax=Leptolyngbya sp. 7M TaxID=2812896 RepID=UPI001B8CCA60|nr:site-2 protease family protein [Leptolyngbya sp. 7M]QYO66055.1 site-2 protease family protein [Leptolyngbya sp. 7M]